MPRVALFLSVVMMVPSIVSAEEPARRAAAGNERLEVFELRHVDLKDAMTIVRGIAQPHRVAGDERTRQLFVYADPDALELARKSIAALDRPLPELEVEVQFRCLTEAPRLGSGELHQLEAAGQPCGGSRVRAMSGETVTVYGGESQGRVAVQILAYGTPDGRHVTLEWDLEGLGAKTNGLVGSWPGPPRIAVVEVGGGPRWVAAIVTAAPVAPGSSNWP